MNMLAGFFDPNPPMQWPEASCYVAFWLAVGAIGCTGVWCSFNHSSPESEELEKTKE